MAKHIPLTRADIKETSVQKGVVRAWNSTNPLRHGSSDHRLLQKKIKNQKRLFGMAAMLAGLTQLQ